MHKGEASPIIATKRISRAELFAGLFILGSANGLSARVSQSIDQLGWAEAAFNTFNVSAIVWFACFAGVSFTLRDSTIRITSVDIAIAAVVLVLVMLPVVSLSWIAMTRLCIYVLVLTDTNIIRLRSSCWQPVHRWRTCRWSFCPRLQ